jgi:outer membrane lipoprotein-sorting protein
MKFKAIIILLLFAAPLFCQDKNPDINEVVRKIDDLYRSKTSYSELEMHIVTPDWERTLGMKAWSEGTKKTFIRILTPPRERNFATLRIGNEMWNFLPNANKVIKIPPSMMMSSWMGSDFTNDDLVEESSMLDDYNYRYVTPENPENGLLYIEFTPKEDKPIVWAKIILAAHRNDYLPVWEKYYDEKGRLMRLLNFKDIKEFGGRKVPSTMEMTPQNKQGHTTVITYKELQFDAPLDKDTFTLRNLRSKE